MPNPKTCAGPALILWSGTNWCGRPSCRELYSARSIGRNLPAAIPKPRFHRDCAAHIDLEDGWGIICWANFSLSGTYLGTDKFPPHMIQRSAYWAALPRHLGKFCSGMCHSCSHVEFCSRGCTAKWGFCLAERRSTSRRWSQSPRRLCIECCDLVLRRVLAFRWPPSWRYLKIAGEFLSSQSSRPPTLRNLYLAGPAGGWWSLRPSRSLHEKDSESADNCCGTIRMWMWILYELIYLIGLVWMFSHLWLMLACSEARTIHEINYLYSWLMKKVPLMGHPLGFV